MSRKIKWKKAAKAINTIVDVVSEELSSLEREIDDAQGILTEHYAALGAVVSRAYEIDRLYAGMPEKPEGVATTLAWDTFDNNVPLIKEFAENHFATEQLIQNKVAEATANYNATYAIYAGDEGLVALTTTRARNAARYLMRVTGTKCIQVAVDTVDADVPDWYRRKKQLPHILADLDHRAGGKAPEIIKDGILYEFHLHHAFARIKERVEDPSTYPTGRRAGRASRRVRKAYDRALKRLEDGEQFPIKPSAKGLAVMKAAATAVESMNLLNPEENTNA